MGGLLLLKDYSIFLDIRLYQATKQIFLYSAILNFSHQDILFYNDTVIFVELKQRGALLSCW